MNDQQGQPIDENYSWRLHRSDSGYAQFEQIFQAYHSYAHCQPIANKSRGVELYIDGRWTEVPELSPHANLGYPTKSSARAESNAARCFLASAKSPNQAEPPVPTANL